MTLADLVEQLQAYVPVVSAGVPSENQYEIAVKDAVANFNLRVGIRRRHALAVVSNVATYALPDDFNKLIELKWLPVSADGAVAITSEGLVPLAAGRTSVYDGYEIVGKQITFYPTPTYTGTRIVWYRAGHYLDDDAYPLMDEADAAIIMLKAQALAWRMAGALGGDAAAGISYSFGAVKVDKKSPTDTPAGRAQKFEMAYKMAITERIGSIIQQQQYTAYDAAVFLNDLH